MMDFFPAPGTEWATVRKGDTGWKVWVVQIGLNSHVPSPNLVEDGIAGPKTDLAIKMLQSTLGITSDGICGPQTQLALCLAACAQMEHARIPRHMSEGIVKGESGGSLCCVSKTYPDYSEDYGCAQVHLTNPTQQQLREAFSPQHAILALVDELAYTHGLYLNKPGCAGGKLPPWLGVEPKAAWACATLHYNWPAAASTYAYGHDATWLEQDFPFVIEATEGKLHTGVEWCRAYVNTKLIGPDPTHPYVTSWAVA